MRTPDLNIQSANFTQGLTEYIHSLNLESEEGDMVQETLIKAISRKGSNTNAFLETWTETMKKKTFINNFRRILLRQKTNDYNDLFLLYDEESDIDQDVVYKKIITVIDQLDMKSKKPFMMYVEGKTYDFIANSLNLKVKTVKSRIFSAKRELAVHNI